MSSPVTDSMSGPVSLLFPATPDTFSEEGYLIANPDVRSAVSSGVVSSGLAHFDTFGKSEGRLQFIKGDNVLGYKAEKFLRLRPLLREDMKIIERENYFDALNDELREETRIIDTNNISCHSYDGQILDLINKYDEGLVLDCGAGSAKTYHRNVVYLEIAAYPSTDVLAVGEALPFKDNSFDAVISSSVLEHVRDPQRCADEIVRVLKPGGELHCGVPFMQPLHGYPHHYFNATHQGLRKYFEDTMNVGAVFVPYTGHPIFSLHWILNSWLKGLPEDQRSVFGDKTINEITSLQPEVMREADYCSLSEDAQFELASGFALQATKPEKA